ncbi:MAG: hypothetical protein Q8O64_10325 [Sideroxyarcus sp.]|nr:hypothetical protein [Sideroxyarcus sp.]
MKMKLIGLMLTVMLLMAGGAAGAEATAYTATGTAAPTCTGAITIAANGVVTCAAGGTQLLSSCSGNIVIDSEGVARCSAAAVAPACTLTQSLFAGQTRLTANCTPAATSYTWSTNTGFASTDSGGFISPAQTTTYTVSGTNAAGSGNTASLTVTVGSTTTGTPSCSLSASPSAISAGGQVTLTASCSPAAASYIWTGSGCAGNASICTASPASSTTYSVAGINAAGTGHPASATVTVTAASAPPTCTLTQALFVGKTRLTANCTPAATSYTWSANTGFASTDSGGFVAPTATTTYTVQGTNAAGTGNTASLTITVAAPTPNCTLTADPAVIDMGGTSTLTASCSPEATSYAWTGAGCTAETVNTCSVTLAAAGITTYTVVGSNADGAGSSASATVTVAKPSCTLTAAPSSVAPNGSSILTANCSPSVGTTYSWTGGACAGKTTSTCDTGALVSSTTYSVTGSNSLGSSTANATVTVAKPDCTLTAAPALIGRGGTSTLTVSCSPAADSYAWTGGTCAGKTDSTCTVTLEAAGIATYNVTGTNLAGDGNTASTTVTAAAPSCSLTAMPSTVSPNSASTLTASCTPAADSYAWTGGTCAGKTTSTCTVTPDATTDYNVTGSDSVGPGNTASATVSVLADPGCPNGYTYTVVPITWAPQISIKGPQHTMNHCEVKAFQFTMPSRPPMQSQTSYGTVPKYLSMSQTAFDFSPSLEASGCAAAGQNNPIIWHSTEAPMAGVCTVVAGATYYLNVRNAGSRDGPDNCPAGSVCTYYLAW